MNSGGERDTMMNGTSHYIYTGYCVSVLYTIRRQMASNRVNRVHALAHTPTKAQGGTSDLKRIMEMK